MDLALNNLKRLICHQTKKPNETETKTHSWRKHRKTKTRWELHEDTVRYLEQILEAMPHKAAAIQPPTCDLTNHSNKTNKICGTLLEKQGRTHKRRSLIDSYRWRSQCLPTSKDLHQLSTDTRYRRENVLRAMDDWDGRRASERLRERKRQIERERWGGTLSCERDFMMMMSIYIYIYIYIYI